MQEFILKESELFKLCEALDLAKNPGIYLLSGNLASGKTTLIQEFVKALGENCAVTSPTYLLSQCYGDRIFHYDIYQKSLQELLELGFLEELEKSGWHFIEWGDENLAKILREVGLSFKSIFISLEKNARKYSIKG
ncbi:MAG: tRNA (adenosine(37)-N6)-threonylcarbamoyltransferase complex ATPase subunit type 1 TsaE [Helicobacteraceae bacterium]|nr:tRNA (adenosine(37)-N6)-threonylcarbamoyltransferase complex ATPase subunit type 1 TsaE [Helicobacteraceae bacterium]